MDEIRSSMESSSDKMSFAPLKVNYVNVLSRIFLSKDTMKLLFGRYMNRILKWSLFIALAAILYFGVAIATNANRCERLRRFFSGEPMQWESADDSADR